MELIHKMKQKITNLLKEATLHASALEDMNKSLARMNNELSIENGRLETELNHYKKIYRKKSFTIKKEELEKYGENDILIPSKNFKDISYDLEKDEQIIRTDDFLFLKEDWAHDLIKKLKKENDKYHGKLKRADLKIKEIIHEKQDNSEIAELVLNQELEIKRLREINQDLEKELNELRE